LPKNWPLGKLASRLPRYRGFERNVMKLILARVLPVVIALLVPSLAAAEESHDKAAPAHAGQSGQTGHAAHHASKRAKATPKAHKAAKTKPAKALRKSAKNPAKLSKKATAR
jgi:hypothetical protein